MSMHIGNSGVTLEVSFSPKINGRHGAPRAAFDGRPWLPSHRLPDEACRPSPWPQSYVQEHMLASNRAQRAELAA
jgi:hypothetical protein